MEKSNYLVSLDKLIEEYLKDYKKILRKQKLKEIIKKQQEKINYGK